MTTPTQHPIRTVLIGKDWYVENRDTGEVWGPCGTSWGAISKMQELRGGKTAEAAKQAVRRERQREPW